jgi:hypothetical protein
METRRERRMAANEAVARRINDSIEYAAPPDGEPSSGFICERVRDDCVERLDITVHAYGAVRSHPRRFIVLPGHEEPEIETIVEIHVDFVVVQKLGEAGRIAEARAY